MLIARLAHILVSKPSAVCIHIHLFKNAGSTVDWILRRSFGGRFQRFDRLDDPANIYTGHDLERYLHKNPRALAVSSHQLRFPLPEIPCTRLFPIVFIRHPLDRALSVYSFERRQGGIAPGNLKAMMSSLEGYLRWRLSQHAAGVVTNFQVLSLSWYHGILRENDRLDERHLATAWERLRGCAVAGVVERFDESLVAAEWILKPFHPALDMAYRPQNVTPGRLRSREERIASGRREIGRALFDRIETLNDLDLELYHLANEELDRRIALIPDFETRLEAFRERCRQLRSRHERR